jgi:hypothetical protein
MITIWLIIYAMLIGIAIGIEIEKIKIKKMINKHWGYAIAKRFLLNRNVI